MTHFAGTAMLVAAILAGPAFAQGDGVTVRTAAQLETDVAVTKDGISSIRLPMGTSQVMVTRRERNGTPELHDTVDDIFVGQAGTVIVLVGGKLEGGRVTAPGEQRDGRIVGGRRVRFGAGDMMLIPAGVPHQMLLEQGPFRYLAFKMPRAG